MFYKSYIIYIFMVGLDKYAERLGDSRSRSSNQYALGHHVLETERSNISKMSDILQHDLKLANISGDDNIRLYQNDILLLVAAYDLASKDIVMSRPFNMLYYGWLGELSITRSKDGYAVKQMASVMAQQPSDRQATGFGQDWQLDQQNELESDRGIINKAKDVLKQRFK
jgi:hypothetical protein